MEFKKEIKIPKERICVLVGTKGEIKRELQKRLNVKIDINSDTGLVSIFGDDGLEVYNAEAIVNAIGRGFNPDIALNLLDENYVFDKVDITEYSKRSRDRLHDLKARVIGSKGRSKKTIESLANVDLCIYGKTVGIIGKVEDVEIAKKAIEKLLQGSKHANVYFYLETQLRNRKEL